MLFFTSSQRKLAEMHPHISFGHACPSTCNNRMNDISYWYILLQFEEHHLPGRFPSAYLAYSLTLKMKAVGNFKT
jgi:hypothetical protein